MKKLSKLALTVILILTLSAASEAQIRVGGGLSFIKFFGGSTYKNLGFGINGEYDLNDKTGLYVGFNYYLPNSTSGTTVVTALSSATVPSFVSVNEKTSQSLMQINLGGKKYLGTNMYKGFGFYAFAQLTILLNSVTTTVDDNYDKLAYAPSGTTSGSESLSSLNIGIGVGASGNVGKKIMVFGNLGLNIPANKVNGQNVEVTMPASLIIDAGVKYSLGKTPKGSKGGKRRRH